ncbi:hypothetical protein E2C01_039686 [Portunus trituberculatus]|uniref:Uncharacterized protein n=1 Tax=Portunus trituberculatus TaxID=210409 RepID=A0A5B7FFD6_PORTR|nr:hypothetical protein [Portunus trituberculatus]
MTPQTVPLTYIAHTTAKHQHNIALVGTKPCELTSDNLFPICRLSNSVEHVLADEGDDALLSLLLLAHHGVGLARPCLSIGEDTHIVAWEREKDVRLGGVNVRGMCLSCGLKGIRKDRTD